MTIFRRLLAPAAFLAALTALLMFAPEASAYLGIEPPSEQARNLLRMARYLGVAWLLSRIAGLVLTRMRPRNRPVPKLLRDLVSGLLYLVAIVSGALLLMGHSTGSALAGSGVVLALLGFAIRNVVADTLSGIALGLEAPFRIGDWVDIEGLARGRVIEIGWRTTRLLTRDSTYVILPNSQISRQRITNFSAPRPDYRDHAELTLPVDLPVAEANALIREALEGAPNIADGKPPEVQVVRYGPAGITYRVKYRVPQHDRELICRNEVFSRIDAALREAGVRLAPPPMAEVYPPGPEARMPGAEAQPAEG